MISFDIIVLHLLGSQVGMVPLHCRLSWQVLELSPISRYPLLQVYFAMEDRVNPDSVTWPFAGPVKLEQLTECLKVWKEMKEIKLLQFLHNIKF